MQKYLRPLPPLFDSSRSGWWQESFSQYQPKLRIFMCAWFSLLYALFNLNVPKDGRNGIYSLRWIQRYFRKKNLTSFFLTNLDTTPFAPNLNNSVKGKKRWQFPAIPKMLQGFIGQLELPIALFLKSQIDSNTLYPNNCCELVESGTQFQFFLVPTKCAGLESLCPHNFQLYFITYVFILMRYKGNFIAK